uniref:At1g61320/AtMIF1 LRR domain-containing protein n=1 Tax=Aegilops tauschii TaxID=37682 RepID=M8B9Z0_AEGTA
MALALNSQHNVDVQARDIAQGPGKLKGGEVSGEKPQDLVDPPALRYKFVDDAHTHSGKQHAQVLIDRVNAVLRKHRGKFVHDLEVKLTFESKLVHHLDNGTRFAISSRTKTLAFDLAPSSNLPRHGYHYTFPFDLLDKESVSYLRCLQLSFVRFKPPSHFVGLPNLRKLDLYLLKGTTRQDLENILGSCCKLEWLSLVRCHLNDELRVVQPLSHLHYLKVIYCEITKIEFHAASLSTFVYDGTYIPIALRHASKLENAKISFRGAVLQHAAASLLAGLPDVQNLTLNVLILQLETRWTLNSPRVFSLLRHVQIMLMISYEDHDKILYIVSFLRVAPLIERLEVHFNGIATMWFSNEGPFRQEVPPCEYTHLKNIRVTGFRGARGQVEFLMHIAENAPALQVVTVDTTQRLTDAWFPDEVKPELNSDALDTCMSQPLPVPSLKRRPEKYHHMNIDPKNKWKGRGHSPVATMARSGFWRAKKTLQEEGGGHGKYGASRCRFIGLISKS